VDFFPEKNIVNAGGNALNVAASCSRTQKADVYLMGNIGTDKYAERIKEVADKYKINRQYLFEIEGETANNKIYITTEGERYEKSDSWTSGVYGNYKISENDEKFMNGFDAIATTFNDPNFKQILEIRHKSNFILSVDFLDHIPNNEWCNYFPAIDLFFISSKKENLPMFKKWSTEYSTLFVATLGEAGSIAYNKGTEYSCEAVKVDKIIDTTGCGDSYQGAFIVDYLLNANILSAMKNGSESAAITLTVVGGC
jgi:fructoselysine 6-kinase